MPYPYDVFTRLVADSWARPEEAAALRLRDTDTDDGFIAVRSVVVEIQGVLFREDATKTTHSSRDIDLSSTTLDVLDDYIADHRKLAAKWFAEHPEHEHPGDGLPLFVGSVVGGSHDRELVDRLDYSKLFRYSSPDRH